MQFFKYIGVDFQDLYHVAELQIEKLYDLDKYLGKLKKKDFSKNQLWKKVVEKQRKSSVFPQKNRSF